LVYFHMMECTVLAEIGPENVECISHISVLGTVPAIVPDIPATVRELFLEMIHCNFTKMYFRPSVNKGSSRQLPYTTIVKKLLHFAV
jgi:hypothetical protein